MPATGTSIEDLLATLDLEAQPGDGVHDIFVGSSQPMPHGRVFGGQALAQSVVAAQRTIGEERPIHSLHGYFLRPGDATKPIEYVVDRIHDGRSFSTRRVQGMQGGLPIFSMIASFQLPSEGLDHHAAMPDGIPGPESLKTIDDVMRDMSDARASRIIERWLSSRPFEVRHVQDPLYLIDPERPREPHQAVWVRARSAMPDSDMLHRAALGYFSDYVILEPILRRHGVAWGTPGVKIASLDHAIWWHRSARVDDWLLYVQESTSAMGGRGFATGRVFTRDAIAYKDKMGQQR